MESAKKKLFAYLKENNVTNQRRLDAAWDFVNEAVNEESKDFPSIRDNFAQQHHDTIIEIVKSLIPKNSNSPKKSKEKDSVETVTPKEPPTEES
jgi:superfamily I DNA/RNA helicase